MIKHLFRFGLVAAGFAVMTSASQGAFTASVGGSAASGQQYANLNTLSGTSGTQGNLNFAGGTIVTGSVVGSYLAPILSGNNNQFFEPTTTPGADSTPYLSTGGSSVTFTFNDGPKTYFGLLWGSIDTANSLSFFNGNTLVGTVTGAEILANLGLGAGTNTAYVNITFDAFTRVVASNPNPSFEIDNIAYGTAVPEPSSLALCGIAGLVGQVARRRFK